jgi:transcriptional antiterminator NusG
MNDDNKNLNSDLEETTDVASVDTQADTNSADVDVAPVGEDTEEISPSEAEEIKEELAAEPVEEQEDVDVEAPTQEDEAAEEAVQSEVDEENAQTAQDLGVSDDVIPSGSESSELTSEESADKTESQTDELQDSEDGSTTEESATDDVTPTVDENPNAKWYVVHTYSGHENRVATNLRQRIESEHLEHKIIDILVPTQDKIEIRGGKKEQVKEKVFPGYILVKMDLDNIAWIAVRTTQGVIGFVGAGTKPVPISDAEVKSIVQFMSQGAAPTFKEVFLVDDTVKIIDGPFADFIGKVESVDKEKGKLRVLVSIFGRETPVELDFLQVSKL